MTDAEIGKLTLADVERIAERLSKAVADIQEARGLLGPTRAPPSEVESADAEPEALSPAAEHRRRQFQPVEAQQPRALRTNHPGGNLSAAERAERNRLIAKSARSAPVDPNLPPEIAAMENAE